MCGIYAVFGESPRPACPDGMIDHRGPDDYNASNKNKCSMEFHRLAINGVVGPNQPIHYNDKMIICNGEIYNYRELGGRIGESDCNVIIPNIEEHGIRRACQLFSGDFAFVMTDGLRVWAARDRVGVRPLFYTKWCDGGIAFASEWKALTHFNTKIKVFKPGHYYDSNLKVGHRMRKWSPDYSYYPRPETDLDIIKENIRWYLEEAVRKRVQTSERPVGFFLSGGLDSSIIAALGAKYTKGPIKTFSIGFADGESPDMIAARKMATFLKSDHTEITFDLDDGIDSLNDVIWHLESHDTTTVRASVPMFILSKWIKENTDIRVILSGEGADELFGGYLYFHKAPSDEQFRYESNRLIEDVHYFDVLRADRCTSAHGLELRVPFFDRDVIDYVLDGFADSVRRPKDGFEKWILRKTFEDILPYSIAWRQKNGMSDAVGYGWVDGLRDQFQNNDKKIFKIIFSELFGNKHKHLTPYEWMPRWSDGVTDPSARQLTDIFNDEEIEDDVVSGVFHKIGLALTLVSAYILWTGLGQVLRLGHSSDMNLSAA
jgi:asparagine synthase (glutamine-hydrolysing)